MRTPQSRRWPFSSVAALAVIATIAGGGCGRGFGGIGSPADVDAPDSDVDPEAFRTTSSVESMDDPRIRHLLDAASQWRRSRGPERGVVDQVVLAADLPSYYAALAAWDDERFFPILIDDPSWTLPFLRAFRPGRVLRFRVAPATRALGENDSWKAASEAVSRSWVREGTRSDELPDSALPPAGMGRTPPGVVLSHAGSPSLAGAVALAAGRFQPLISVDLMKDETPGKVAGAIGFADVATEAQALAFARLVEERVAAVTKSHGALGDDVDFLTLAGDWPYRYLAGRAKGFVADERALDDLLGRVLRPGASKVDGARDRWAYTGRLTGDPAASAYRAMCSLFLQPNSALLWNTYAGGPPWSDYDAVGAGRTLGLIRSAPGAVEVHSGATATLQDWHSAFRSRSFDLLMANSSGGPGDFTIAGGPGRSADVPFDSPRLVSLIHSFSAADPLDAGTIAGRFLDNGAFIYFGSLNEPFLTAFRTPYLVSQLIAGETPMAAAFRQGPLESFGHPWRLVYLGDPLYRIDPFSAASRTPRIRSTDPGIAATPLDATELAEAVDQAATLDWCYDVVLLALSRPDASPGAAEHERRVLPLLSAMDRERLDPTRRERYDALFLDRKLAVGDFDGLLDGLLRLPPRSRTPRHWRSIETISLDLLALRFEIGRFREALDLWLRLVVAPWPSGSEFPKFATSRLETFVDADPATRATPFVDRLVEARDRVSLDGHSPGRKEWLEELLKRRQALARGSR